MMPSLLDEDYEFAAGDAGTPDNPEAAAETPIRTVLSWPVSDYAESAKNSRATVAMVVLFMVGAATVWYLSRDVGAAPVDPADQVIEAQVNAFLEHCGSKAAQAEKADVDIADQLVSVFNDYCLNIALPKGRINSNPYILHPTAAAKQVDQSPRESKIMKQLAALKLTSIMHTGQGSTAIINNKFAGVGTRIDEFTVADIRTDAVVLSYGDLSFILKMQTGAMR